MGEKWSLRNMEREISSVTRILLGAWRRNRITKVPSILADNRVPSGNLSG